MSDSQTPRSAQIIIRSTTPGAPGSLRLRDLLAFPFTDQATIKGPDGTDIPVPDGSIRQHLQRRLHELGGLDGFVELIITSTKTVQIEVSAKAGQPNAPQHLDEIMRRELAAQGLGPIHVPIQPTPAGPETPTEGAEPQSC